MEPICPGLERPGLIHPAAPRRIVRFGRFRPCTVNFGIEDNPCFFVDRDLASMRVLNIIPSLNLATGGPAIACLNIAKGLAAAGHTVTIFSTNWPNALPDGYSPDPTSGIASIQIRLFRCLRFAGLVPLPWSPAMVEAVSRECHQFDRIICHSLWNPTATFIMDALRWAGTPYLLMPHGMLDPLVFARHRFLKSACARLWERANVEGASILAFNSDFEREKAGACGWRFPQTLVFPHALDLAYWGDLPPRTSFEYRFPQVKGREVILFVGRIDWVKNLNLLLEALPIVRQSRPAAMLVCVGPDNDGYQSKLEQMARARNLHEHILFTGMQTGDHLKAAYARGDVFALVSKKENFGLAAAEALASGLPVVLSEGVDLGKDWQNGGPVERTLPVPDAMAGKLVQMLERTARTGLPDQEALSLARTHFESSPISQLLCYPGKP
jgi:glycosyltransferase involved in cell wall biosynthesis